MTAQDGPRTPPEALQIMTRSLRETLVRSKAARGSHQRPPKGAQEASRGLQGAPKKIRGAPKRLSNEEPPQKELRMAGKCSQGGATKRKRKIKMRKGTLIHL